MDGRVTGMRQGKEHKFRLGWIDAEVQRGNGGDDRGEVRLGRLKVFRRMNWVEEKDVISIKDDTRLWGEGGLTNFIYVEKEQKRAENRALWDTK